MTKYTEVMDRLTATPEMEQRFLARVGAELSSSREKKMPVPLIRYVSMVASVVLVVLAALALRSYLWGGGPAPVAEITPAPTASAEPSQGGQIAALPPAEASPSAPGSSPKATARPEPTKAPEVTPTGPGEPGSAAPSEPPDFTGATQEPLPVASPTREPPPTAEPSPSAAPSPSIIPPESSDPSEKPEPGEGKPPIEDPTNPGIFFPDERDVVRYASAEEMSQAVGFLIEDLAPVLANAADVDYYGLEDGAAEIVYGSPAWKIVYRKLPGEQDIFEIGEDYEVAEIVEINGHEVLFRGEADGYRLAAWNRDGYFYFISLSRSSQKEPLIELVSAAK